MDSILPASTKVKFDDIKKDAKAMALEKLNLK